MNMNRAYYLTDIITWLTFFYYSLLLRLSTFALLQLCFFCFSAFITCVEWCINYVFVNYVFI